MKTLEMLEQKRNDLVRLAISTTMPERKREISTLLIRVNARIKEEKQRLVASKAPKPQAPPKPRETDAQTKARKLATSQGGPSKGKGKGFGGGGHVGR